MREIKFRSFRNNQMSKPFTIGEGVCWPNGTVSTANNLEVMQYTGLKDKNGVEIYEGDIIEIIWCHGVKSDIARVYYDLAPNFQYMAKTNIGTDHYFVGIFDLCEVIGNIYQNPELLLKG